MRTIFAAFSMGLGITCFIPYIRDIFHHKTTPHSYSWLVWTILQATIVLAMLNGGAGLGVLPLIAGAVFCGFIFLLSLRYGTKNITTFDEICFISSLGAIGVYIFINDVFLSILVVTLVDIVAFMPTFRKTYEEPYSETMATYFLTVISSILALGALSVFNLNTSLFLISQVVMNTAVVGIITTRRKRKM